MTISSLFNQIQILRKYSNERELPAQLIATFLYIAHNPGKRQEEIAEACQISNSAASRNISWLGKYNKLKRRSGLRWVESYKLDGDHRSNYQRLTPLGQRIVDELR